MRSRSAATILLSSVALAAIISGPAGCKDTSAKNAAPPPTSAPGDDTTAKTPTAATTPTGMPAPLELPRTWFESDFDSWVGKPWTEIELFRFMKSWPKDIADGERYVVFYRRSCDHCEEMFNVDFAGNPALAAKVTAVEVPEEKDVMRTATPWPMPSTKCELMELPMGVNWVVTTPIALRLENGVVTCATEGDHKECLGLE